MTPDARRSRWGGLIAVGAGAVLIGAAFLAEDAKFHAPRWLVAMIGTVFVLTGIMLIRSARAPHRRPETDVTGSFLGGLVTTGFTVVSLWALLFSGGPKAWKVSGSLPFWWFPGWVTAALFYGMLGIGTLICLALTAFAWRQAYRALVPGTTASLSDPRRPG